MYNQEKHENFQEDNIDHIRKKYISYIKVNKLVHPGNGILRDHVKQ